MKLALLLCLGLMLVAVASAIRGGTNSPGPSYVVSIQEWPEKRNVCTGVLIAPNRILTAAHCVYGWYERDLRLVAGNPEARNGHVLEINSYKVHPNYDAQSHANDIAMIIPRDPKNILRQYSTAKLARGDVSSGTKLATYGFGEEYQLKKLEVTVQKRDNCDPDGFQEMVANNQICAQPGGGDQGACAGDKGGPLVWNNKVAGLFSYWFTTVYEPECDNGKTMVWTRVSQFENFVKNNCPNCKNSFQ